MRSDTTPAAERQLPAIWTATRSRIDALLDGLTDDDGSRMLPTVQGATVADLVAHMNSTLAKAADDPAKLCEGVFAHPVGGTAGSPLRELVSAWRNAADMVGERLSSPDIASFLITDAVTSEHDLRTALDLPGARDDVAVKVALDELSGRFSDRVDAAGLPPLRVTVEQWGTIAGTGRAITCVVADRFEFVRAMSGRRSRAEIHRWNWGEDPDVYIPVMAEAEIPSDEVHERDPRIPEHMRDREFVL
jgi:hypothetical protein